jgi:hypothetical protein
MLITALSHVDPANDTVILVLDMVGTDPFQHEFLKQVFGADLSTTDDEYEKGPDGKPVLIIHGKPLGPEDLRIRLPFTTKGAMEAARRKLAGLPSVEQEAADNAAAEKAAADAKAAAEAKASQDAEAQKSAETRAAEQKQADLVALGNAIAAGINKAKS